MGLLVPTQDAGGGAPGLAPVKSRLLRRGQAASRLLAFGESAQPGEARGRARTPVNGRGGLTAPRVPTAGAGGGAPTQQVPRVGAWAELSPSNAPPRPAPWLAAGACPQHGLARLACAVAVGLRLRAAAPRPCPAREPPQLPSAANPPWPAHGAQQAAALPNRVSAGSGGKRGSGRQTHCKRRGGGRRKAWGFGQGKGWEIQGQGEERSERQAGDPLIWGELGKEGIGGLENWDGLGKENWRGRLE